MSDAGPVKLLFDLIYGGKYPDSELEHLAEELLDRSRNLCIVTEFEHSIVGCVMIKMDHKQRIGKCGRGLLLPEFRRIGLAQTMLRQAINHLCLDTCQLDLVYGTSRTVNPGPANMSAAAGMMQMGLFPNAVQIDSMEHLNLEVYFSPGSLAKRRSNPSILVEFKNIFDLAMESIGINECASLVPFASPMESKCNRALIINRNQEEVARRYQWGVENELFAIPFYPFQLPNMLLVAEDVGEEVFVWYDDRGKRAAITGYRSDCRDVGGLFRAVAATMESYGAANLELLVSAHDPIAQQGAYAARFLPCAYFPAMHLRCDGCREDYLILSRTFRLLDFGHIAVSQLNAKFLRVYMLAYYRLYIEPLLGPLPPEVVQ